MIWVYLAAVTVTIGFVVYTMVVGFKDDPDVIAEHREKLEHSARSAGSGESENNGTLDVHSDS